MSNPLVDRIATCLKRHEGLRLKPYKDTVGKTTIGYGRNLDDVGLREVEADYLLLNDMTAAMKDVNKIFQGCQIITENKYLQPRYAAMVDMRFNLGPTGFRGFRRMIEAVKSSDWPEAAKQMKDSKWYDQVGYRGRELVNMVETNTWPHYI